MKNPEKIFYNKFLKAMIKFFPYNSVKKLLVHIYAAPLLNKYLKNFSAQVFSYFTRYFPELSQKDSRKIHNNFLRHYKDKFIDDCYIFNCNPVDAISVFQKNIVLRGKEHIQKTWQNKGQKGNIILAGSHIGSVIYSTFSLLFHGLFPGNNRRDMPPVILCTDPNKFYRIIAGRWLNSKNTVTIPDINYLPVEGNPHSIGMKLIRILKNNSLVLANIDVLMGGKSRKTFDFFQKSRVYFPALHSLCQIASLTKAPLIPWFNYRDKQGNLIIEINEPLFWPDRPLDKTERKNLVDKTSKKMFNIFIEYLKSYPEQWVYWDRLQYRLKKPEQLPANKI